jgi:hypothetical protein
LFAALADGTVVPFSATSQARLQVIHNAADPAAASVDIYVNGNLELDNFAFRTATPYIDVPAGVLLNIGVAPGNSMSVNDTLKSFMVTLAHGGAYIAVANGVLNPSNFAVNPDAASTAFTLFLQDMMRESALTTDVDFRVVHGSSDAPIVDVLANAGLLVDNASYSDITPYFSVPAANYILDVTPGNDNTTIVASYAAPLSGLAGQSAVILASGFLAVLADGTAFLLSIVTGIEDQGSASSFNMYPNPATDVVNISLSENANNAIVEITNALGQIVKTEKLNNSSITIPVNNLSKGMYFVNVRSENGKSDAKLIVK